MGLTRGHAAKHHDDRRSEQREANDLQPFTHRSSVSDGRRQWLGRYLRARREQQSDSGDGEE